MHIMYIYNYTYRTMLQVDPRRRPRVEELEALPALQPAMGPARSIHSDFKQQQVLQCCLICTVCVHRSF